MKLAIPTCILQDNKMLVLRLAKLYAEEGVDVAIRRVAEIAETTHTRLLRIYGSKENVLFQNYRYLLQGYVMDSALKRTTTLHLPLNQVLNDDVGRLKSTFVGSISMQLWARECFRDRLLKTTNVVMYTVCTKLGMNNGKYPESKEEKQAIKDTFLSFLTFNTPDQQNKAGSDMIIRSAFTLFLSVGGIQMLGMLGNENLPGSLESMELSVVDYFAEKFSTKT